MTRARTLSTPLLLLAASAMAGDGPYTPDVKPASAEGERAIGGFKAPEGVKVSLWAAEPLLANPVAFDFDNKGRLFVAETYRLHRGVTDDRGHMDWLDVDLAARTVGDRVQMYKDFAKGAFHDTYEMEHDRVKLVVDKDGDGKADTATVFADGFNTAATGLGAGVMARKGQVYYTCIPDLWLLKDTDGDGKADVRESLQTGYGVHVGFLGHDLHGLKMGPDGRLYFSIGDRGVSVVGRDGSKVDVPDTGSVFRCEPDGSKLEVYSSGLRNPQELAFDERGDLFTVDNNSDGGDKARLIHLVHGSDSGWRIGWQFIEQPNPRGPWNGERMWETDHKDQPKFLLPPLANISDGPSGFTYHPGTGLLPERYKNHFFLADFRGSANNSGVRAFTVKPKGASYELGESEQFLWGIEATDVDFGPDGAIYVSDWVEGWNCTGKGRIYRLADQSRDGNAAAGEVKALLADGFTKIDVAGLVKLLGHADQRVRTEAELELADRGAIDALLPVALAKGDVTRRLHGLWGASIVARRARGDAGKFAAVEAMGKALVELSKDEDAEIRAQAIKAIVDYPVPLAVALKALADPSPRVRFQAATAVGHHGSFYREHQVMAAEATAGLKAILKDDGATDPYLRHAATLGLAGLLTPIELAAWAKDDAPIARLGAVLALRRLASPEVAAFLTDADANIAAEAARAINDGPIDAALGRLAALEAKSGLPRSLLRRILNANIRVGGDEGAGRLASMAGDAALPSGIRVEALDALAAWAKPPGRDRVNGLWRPLPTRPAEQATVALSPRLEGIVKSDSESVRQAAARAAGSLAIKGAGPTLLALVADTARPAEGRVEALRALDRMNDPMLAEAVKVGRADRSSALRAEALRSLARTAPAEALPAIEASLAEGPTAERQGAFATLGAMADDGSAAVLGRWLARLSRDEVAAEVRLDLVDAAARRKDKALDEQLARRAATYPAGDVIAPYRDALAGGDPARGRKVFLEKSEAACLRCHKLDGQGGEVGPELTGIGARKDRAYLLESIVNPNAQIAQGYETTVVGTADGKVLAGVLKGEDAGSLRLMTPEGKLVVVPKADVEERTRGLSAMPQDTINYLSKAELRDLVEYLAASKAAGRDASAHGN